MAACARIVRCTPATTRFSFGFCVAEIEIVPSQRWSGLGGSLRCFAAHSGPTSGAVEGSVGSAPRETDVAVGGEPPGGTGHERRRRRAARKYWSPEDLPLWRRIGAQWGGLMFFGFFMGLSWIAKKYGEHQEYLVDAEIMSERADRRSRRRRDLNPDIE
eukprot:TRINITY_DN78974_c0_g1_i1.p1 TRINITY_DN78974_c0_g1~~TRINITY_DN78974_c0_g1_i1.p1  ORF type:complete len:159 (-),score=20.35 TRINITY_DN78974_c0_g1_i1:45-521(-)